MLRPKKYKTKQREAVLRYVASLHGGHVTAAQIVRHFAAKAAPVGRTTVYRHLDALTESGELRRYTTGGPSGACYQYVGGSTTCAGHLHLKCECCGELRHLEGEALGDIQKQVLDKYAFAVNALKTVLYGTCEACRTTQRQRNEPRGEM